MTITISEPVKVRSISDSTPRITSASVAVDDMAEEVPDLLQRLHQKAAKREHQQDVERREQPAAGREEAFDGALAARRLEWRRRRLARALVLHHRPQPRPVSSITPGTAMA